MSCFRSSRRSSLLAATALMTVGAGAPALADEAAAWARTIP
ncbi:hypothetical protein ABC365_14355 [Brevundimonas sp. 3P9-tot-E]